MDLSTILQNVFRDQREKKFFSTFNPGKDALSGVSTNNHGYFQFRLSEMYLKDRRVCWKGYIPMVISLVTFLYDGQKKMIPVYVGNNLLGPLGDIVENQDIEYYNTNILGPVPYLGGDVGFFLGLFQVQANDLCTSLFNFAENLMGVFNVGQLSAYVKIAGAIEKGLSGLLGLKEIRMQMGNRTVFTGRSDSPFHLGEKYALYVNCPEKKVIKNQFQIKNDRLFSGTSRDSMRPYTDHDFCLVKIECPAKRNDYRALGFTGIYDKAVAEIYKNNEFQARSFLLALIQKVSESPDLTQAHRFSLIQAYTANYEKQWERCLKILGGPQKKRVAVRGARTKMTAGEMLTSMAYIAHEKNMSDDTENGLLCIGKHINSILDTHDPEKGLSDQDLNRHLDEISLINTANRPQPKELVSAISLAYEKG